MSSISYQGRTCEGQVQPYKPFNFSQKQAASLESIFVLSNIYMRTAWKHYRSSFKSVSLDYLRCSIAHWETDLESLPILTTWKLVSNGLIGFTIDYVFSSCGGIVLWLLLSPTANWSSQQTSNGNINFSRTKLEIPVHLSPPITFNLN